jgi:hypothetical protein
MDKKDFKDLIEQFDIPCKAEKAFWVAFENYRNDDSDEFSRIFNNGDVNKLFINIQTISFKLGNWPECNYNHIVVWIPIYYEDSHVGDYNVMFSLDGEIDDDMFNTFF